MFEPPYPSDTSCGQGRVRCHNKKRLSRQVGYASNKTCLTSRVVDTRRNTRGRDGGGADSAPTPVISTMVCGAIVGLSEGRKHLSHTLAPKKSLRQNALKDAQPVQTVHSMQARGWPFRRSAGLGNSSQAPMTPNCTPTGAVSAAIATSNYTSF